MTSNLKHLILERIRITLNLLRKSSYILNEKNNKNNGNTIPTVLKDLQELLRNEQNEINIKTVLLPFLSIINSKSLSGPYIRIAVESIQVFISHDAFDSYLDNKSELFSDVVDAILRCKFVQTDLAGDEIVSFQLLETIKILIESKYSSYLPNSIFWKLFEFSMLILNDKGPFIMQQLAERTIKSIVKSLIFQSSSSSEEMMDAKMDKISSLCDVLQYFISGIKTRADMYSVLASNNNYNQSANSVKVNQTQLQQQMKLQQLPLYLQTEASIDADTLYLMFVLKTLSLIFIDQQSGKLIQDLMIRSSRFYSLVTDELGLSLLLLCNSKNSSTYSATILHSALSLFSTLLNTVGPCIRIFVEFFIRQVYFKALIQTHMQMENVLDSNGAVSLFVNKISSSNQVDNSDYYRTDEVELIFESLCDLLSDYSLLPTLFVSYDCNGTSVDIVQPLISYICKCSSLVLSFSSEFMIKGSSFKDRSILIIQLFKQIIKTCEFREKLKLSNQNNSVDTLDSFQHEKRIILKKLLKASRTTKSLLLEASKQFEIKPEKGLKYLQKYGALPTPLTAESVAKFIRVAPELSKDTTGAFLGELGKDSSSGYEANSKEFHAQLLLKYVSLFEFSNQSVLDCMRIFLSAFRLPGEAQQIDRILVAFSEHCHSNCKEGKLGTIQNAEITYILTFSIIMLNTDRHNPNIKAERKMTKEQFVRNNKNYGKDVKQTVDLSREYLEEIFDSIDEYPIRTNGNDISAPFSIEVWKDLQMQATADVKKSILVTLHSTSFLENLTKSKSTKGNFEPNVIEEFLSSSSYHSEINNIDIGITSEEKSAAYIAKRIFTDPSGGLMNPLELALELNGLHWIIQEDIMKCIWLDLFRVCICIHLQKYVDMQQSIAFDLELGQSSTLKGSALLKDRQLRKLLSISNEFLMTLISVSHANNLDFVIQLSVVVLIMCSGMSPPTLQNKLIKYLSWENSTDGLSFLARIETTKSELLLIDPDLLLYQFRHFEGARSSAITLLSITHTYQSNLSNWLSLFYFLGALRDCTLIPKKILVELQDEDLLPPNIRLEFEHQLLELDRAIFEETRPKLPKRVKRASSSLLSFQGIGEALFGTDNAIESHSIKDEKENVNSKESVKNSELLEFQAIFKFSAVSSRWDDGYEINNQHSHSDLPTDEKNVKSVSSIKIKEIESESIPAYTILDGGLTLQDLRELISNTGISQIISDSRFLSESSLLVFIDSLITATEATHDRSDNHALYPTNTKENEYQAIQGNSNCFDLIEQSNIVCKDLLLCCDGVINSKCLFSSATTAWLEIVLVEVSLRNRDRFNIIWPSLKRHYSKVLSGSYAKVSHITENRIVGLLKICTRMLSRDNYSSEIVEYMGTLFARSIHHGTINDSSDTLPNISSISDRFLQHFSNQIAASMWKVITINVDLLPLLPLEQWQILFSILAFCGSSSSFSAIKSFECMAWLLHEPRLIAKVPVFCIIGVKPLLRNLQAPLTVSIGAVHLLMHLHSRLEVLIKDEHDDYVDCEEIDDNSNDEDTPVLWESCWTPILKALVDGIKDTRVEVREACAEALCQTILDRHAQAAPAGVLMLILGGIISPMIIHLRDHVIHAINKALPIDFPVRFLTSEDIYSVAQQQWVDVKSSTTESESEIILTSPDKANEVNTALESLLMFDNGTVSILMECLSALCKSLMSHLKKLASYPSFDKLWLCILNVLGHFINSNYVNGNNEFSSILKIWDSICIENKNHVKDLYAMISSSKENLKRMLQMLKKEGIFNLRPGLLIVTIDTIRQFHGYQDIMESINN